MSCCQSFTDLICCRRQEPSEPKKYDSIDDFLDSHAQPGTAKQSERHVSIPIAETAPDDHFPRKDSPAPGNFRTDVPPRPTKKPTEHYLQPDEKSIANLTIERNQIIEKEWIKNGRFAVVYKGKLKPNIRVAIKEIKRGTMSPQDFLAEAKMMKSLEHENLLPIYAVVAEEPLYLVTEYMKNGNLRDYLRKEGKTSKLPHHIYVASQISDGMAYLESNNYIHRDLRAQNILVGHSLRCKISDFGLARLLKEDEYNASTPNSSFQFKWAAPEVITYNRFNPKSDVWSFGILLAEIVTNGGEPYPGMKDHVIGEKIPRGDKLPKPPQCPDNWYEIMTRCWELEPNQRPSFAELKNTFNGLQDANSQIGYANSTFTMKDEDLPPPPNE